MPYLRSVTINQERESWRGAATSTATGETVSVVYKRFDSHVEIYAETDLKVKVVDAGCLPPTTTLDDALNYIARDLNAVTF